MTHIQTFRFSYWGLTVAVILWTVYINGSTDVFELMAWCFFMILAVNCWVADMLTKGKDGC
jgi:hypothetical protein